MKNVVNLLCALGLATACGSAENDGLTATGGAGSGGAGNAGGQSTGGTSGSGGGPLGGAAGVAGAGGPSDGGLDAATDGPVGTVPSPLDPGPFTTTIYSATAQVAATGNAVPLRCHVPAADAGKVPLVVVAHGFQLPASQYDVTTRHLATFGFVACTADYPAGFSPNHAKSAQDLSGSVDYLLGASAAGGNPVSGRIDETQVGLTGHSLGGKLSVIAAANDTRIRAVLGIDPVDSSMLCSPANCPDASELLPLPIPTGFLGEVTDATGTFQACAPKADNFETFYANASAPSFQVTVIGANHMSFLDSPSTCGTVCSFCNPATAPHGEVIAITRAYVVSFFSRHLAQNLGYDTWLTGVEAQTRWVAPGKIALLGKP